MVIGLNTVKIAYVVLAFIAMFCAIVAAFFHQQYVALGFIVLASAILLAGSMLLSYLHKLEKERELKKL